MDFDESEVQPYGITSISNDSSFQNIYIKYYEEEIVILNISEKRITNKFEGNYCQWVKNPFLFDDFLCVMEQGGENVLMDPQASDPNRQRILLKEIIIEDSSHI